jgi:predicted nucleic acid-binding protein
VKASATNINYLIDAGPLVGLLDGDDQWHEWSEAALAALDETRLASTETAVAEACHLLRHHRRALAALVDMIAAGVVRLVPTLSEDSLRIGELLTQYPRMDAGDATLVALSECYPRSRLITVDRTDFTVYRRKDGSPVPCIMPPSSIG